MLRSPRPRRRHGARRRPPHARGTIGGRSPTLHQGDHQRVDDEHREPAGARRRGTWSRSRAHARRGVRRRDRRPRVPPHQRSLRPLARQPPHPPGRPPHRDLRLPVLLVRAAHPLARRHRRGLRPRHLRPDGPRLRALRPAPHLHAARPGPQRDRTYNSATTSRRSSRSSRRSTGSTTAPRRCWSRKASCSRRPSRRSGSSPTARSGRSPPTRRPSPSPCTGRYRARSRRRSTRSRSPCRSWL